MRKFLFLASLFMPALSFAGDKNKLSGNWREVSRKTMKNEAIAYKDTIKIEFLPGGNEYVWQKAGGFIYKGTYKLEANGLDLGMRYFTVAERKGNKMILKDEGGIYEMESYTPVANTPEAKRQEVFAPVKTVQQMAGHWSVYKRTSANKVNAIDYSRQLKMVDFYPSQKDGKWGAFFATKDADNAPSWMVETYVNQIVYLDGKDKRQFTVIKCADNELIMEEDGVTYYFRQFK
ncbi:MAG TPA: hypothetical protein VK167_04055 [Flavipsychrobacter sp.]|jgi:hypothetical protein|nr:hypothetical protein [Flavipsychrobacter sp.]